MGDTETLARHIANSPLESIVVPLMGCAEAVQNIRPHGDREKWDAIIEGLPKIVPSVIDFTLPTIQIGCPGDLNDINKQHIEQSLLALHPWRKGPFRIFGINIDSEWRSNLKWTRLENKISPLKDRLVLDVGCGNGYYMLRMLGAGARYVLGIDPTRLFNSQFAAIKTFVPNAQTTILPLRCEELPFADIKSNGAEFDTVFSLGILYHRKDATTHLRELSRCLKPGGELVLETLMLEGEMDEILVPDKTYAKMRNVWCIPTESKLHSMLNASGFNKVQTIDISTTSTEEQRKTRWMNFESLSDFLDPADHTKTIEGYPVPKRIVVTGIKL